MHSHSLEFHLCPYQANPPDTPPLFCTVQQSLCTKWYVSQWRANKKRNIPLFNGHNAHQRGCMALWDLPTTQQEPVKTFWEAEYSQKMDMPTVMTIRGHSRGAAAHMALRQEEKQGTAVCWANGPNTGSLSVADVDSRWWNKLGKAFMRIATFRPFQWIPPGASEDIHLPKPLTWQPPAKSDTIQYNAWPILVKHRGWGCAVWSPCLLSKLVSAICILMVCLLTVVTPRNKCVLRKRDA